jgi:acetylornithine/N-succinyldiaminopimelate aminotransferase
MPTYRRYPVRLVRGEGLHVFDDEGRAYLDFAGGIAAVPLGHGHPRWLAAVHEQLDRLVHVSNLYSTNPQEQLAERLRALGGFGLVFLANSGAEANEAALKVVRKYGRAHGRLGVVALDGSFHGRTFATLATTGQPDKRAPFEPLPDVTFVPPNDDDALDDAVDETTAAVLLEPVLGEGGIVPLTDDYLGEARRLCDERGALLVFDEVQTGIGRCGAWFAFQDTGVRPDVFTLAKGLANGLPIGATVAADHLAFGPGEHASTFGGGPVPCAGALAVLTAIEEEGLLENAKVQGKRLAAGLDRALAGAGLPGRGRGRGLLLGAPVGPDARAGAVVRALLARGFLATEAGGETVRCTPPLTVDAESVDAFVDAFAAALADALEPAEAEVSA